MAEDPALPAVLGDNDPPAVSLADEANDGIGNDAPAPTRRDLNDASSAFDRNSGVVRDQQAIEALLRRSPEFSFPPVEGYSPFEDPEVDRGLLDYYGHRFIDVRSPEERRAQEREIQREEQNAALIHSSGWMGVVAAAAAGLPSLTTWIPGGPEYVAGELKYRPGHAVFTASILPPPEKVASRDASAPPTDAFDSSNAVPDDVTAAVAYSATDAQPGDESVSLADRARLHDRVAYFGTLMGLAQLDRWAGIKQSIDAGFKDDQLIAKHAPALNWRGQEARRQTTLEYFRTIPELYDEAMADKARYEAMSPASTVAEGAAAVYGHAKGGVWGVENFVGAGLLTRFLLMLGPQAKLQTPSNPPPPGQSIETGTPQTSGWWQTATPAQIEALNNDAFRAGMVIAGAPPLQPGQGAAADQGRRPSPPAVQPFPPSDDGLGLPPPLSVPLNPTQPVSVPGTGTQTQSKADEKEEDKEWGVYFFGDDVVGFIDRPNATLGLLERQQFFMPLEDSDVIVDAASAREYTGAAPSVDGAYKSGGPIYGVKFPLKGRPYRMPTREDAKGHEHFLEGGHTAIRHSDGTYTVNWNIREYVTPGGGPMPQGAELFVLEKDGTRRTSRTW